LLSEADIMVLPSYNEGLPLAILEALAASVTVITTPVGAIPEIIESEISGFLVEPGDLESLTATLKRLIVDPSLRQVIGGAGRANFELHANIDLIASRILNIYQEISDVRIVN
jgi:glycosyltransferase involved in cell wall biosynthesis